MKKQIHYLYIGTNGTILSPIHLEDTYYIRKIKLFAEEGKKITKDGKSFEKVIIIPEDELELWYEVDE